MTAKQLSLDVMKVSGPTGEFVNVELYCHVDVSEKHRPTALNIEAVCSSKTLVSTRPNSDISTSVETTNLTTCMALVETREPTCLTVHSHSCL
jgi:hypothetical protein